MRRTVFLLLTLALLTVPVCAVQLPGELLDALPEEAAALAALIKDQQGHVNLIPVNPIKERDYVQSDSRAILNFKNKLEKSGINVTIRREMGRDIDGACGQLRKSYMDTEKER